MILKQILVSSANKKFNVLDELSWSLMPRIEISRDLVLTSVEKTMLCHVSKVEYH